MVDAVSSSNAAAASGTGRARLAENFDTFLSLLTTQLKNQDPLAPMDSTQFTQQLVQMTGVEQQLLTNEAGFRWAIQHGCPKGLPLAFTRRMYQDMDWGTKRAILKLYRATGDLDGRSRMLEKLLLPIKPPTLVIWGERDEMISPEHGTLFCQDIQRCRLVTYPTLGHLPQEEDPEGTLPDLVSFLAN